MLAGKIRHRKNMKKVIEAEFFPLNSDHDLSPPVSVGDSAVTEKGRILIVDKDGGEVAARIESDPIQRSNGLTI